MITHFSPAPWAAAAMLIFQTVALPAARPTIHYVQTTARMNPAAFVIPG